MKLPAALTGRFGTLVEGSRMNQSMLPVKYVAARKALAEARLEIAKEIHDKSIGVEVYAIRAKDAELASHAVAIKMLAQRRIGELIETMPKAKGGGGGPGRGKKGKYLVPKKPGIFPSLAQQGINQNLAAVARAAWRLTKHDFERELAKAQRMAFAVAEGIREVIKEARAERHRKRKKQRAKREKIVAENIAALPQKRYGVILADPEWRFEAWSEKGLDSTSAHNHYGTSPLDEIKRRDVGSLAADDSVLFLWATVPMLPQALEVMNAWGFGYVSNFAWHKNKAGTGYWNRNKHEHLLIGTRGKIPAPADGMQFESVIVADVRAHSQKPDAVYEIIEAYFPNIPKIELNLRGAPRPGWDGWGAEAELEAAE